MTNSVSKTEGTDGAFKDKESGDAKKKGNNHVSRGPNYSVRTSIKFEGKCVDLKGHIYDCSDAKQSDIFAKTTKEVAGYVGRTFKYGGDMQIAVENLELPSIEIPTDPPDDASKTELRIWEKGVDEHVRRINYLKENVKTLYSLIWGQCTDIMQQKVEAMEDFEVMSAAGDGMLLLKAIKNITYHFQSQKYVPHSLYESKK